ncbi:flagellar hook-basal body complex protein [Tissierellaceae bacterium HCP3S3_D8]
MLRSLYSGVSGMRSFQTKMDVISNNIANVNTTGFKSGRVRFQDMLSQNIANAQSPTASGLGGINGQQIGLGVKVGSIDTIMTGGALQPTYRDLDFAIEEGGFFIVSSDAGATTLYTRDGAFYTDHKGNLVNSGGLRVLGYVPDGEIDPESRTYADLSEVDEDNPGVSLPEEDEDNLRALTIPPYLADDGSVTEKGDGDDDTVFELQEYTVDGTGKVIGVYSNGTESKTFLLGQIGMVKFQNSEGLSKAGGNNYKATENSGVPEAGVAGGKGYGYIRQGFLEMSNVDLANEFTEMIVTSRAYQANSRSITTSDEMLQELINLKR